MCFNITISYFGMLAFHFQRMYYDKILMLMYIDRCAAVQPSTAVPSFNGMGLLLLSKRPLFNSIAVDMYPNTPQLYRRGYIQSFVSSTKTPLNSSNRFNCCVFRMFVLHVQFNNVSVHASVTSICNNDPDKMNVHVYDNKTLAALFRNLWFNLNHT